MTLSNNTACLGAGLGSRVCSDCGEILGRAVGADDVDGEINDRGGSKARGGGAWERVDVEDFLIFATTLVAVVFERLRDGVDTGRVLVGVDSGDSVSDIAGEALDDGDRRSRAKIGGTSFKTLWNGASFLVGVGLAA